MRGVPLSDIVSGTTSKLQEIHLYNQSRMREIELEAELWATSHNPLKQTKLKAELQSIQDSYKRMSIYPLLENGEFNTIAGVGESADDLDLTSGRVSEWLEKQANRLPPGARTVAKYGMIARGTTLYHGLEALMEYGDFIAKGILYDNLTQKKGLSQTDALGRITEEFVNYPRLAGRGRAYTDNMGMTWFFHYKTRIAKIALDMARNNPFHALLSYATPFLNETNSVLSDNIFAKALEGHLGYSIGPHMALRGLNMGPLGSLITPSSIK
jgi:hypothetical protein